jgi:hypothetical protein
MDLTTCPECGAPAEITRRSALESTDGPMEHVQVHCVRRHWFLMPTAMLAERPKPAGPPREPREPSEPRPQQA